MHGGSIPSTAPLSPTAPDSLDDVDDFELIGDDLDSLLDSSPIGQDETEVPVVFFCWPSRPDQSSSFFTDRRTKRPLKPYDALEGQIEQMDLASGLLKKINIAFFVLDFFSHF